MCYVQENCNRDFLRKSVIQGNSRTSELLHQTASHWVYMVDVHGFIRRVLYLCVSFPSFVRYAYHMVHVSKS